jgi:hypothetical protein
MASTYVNDLRLNEMATGDASGTWGTITNTNLELIGEALGYGTQDCFTSDADATTTVADGATDPARAIYFKVTSSATLTATRTLTIAPNTVSRLQFIENATTGSQSINISQGSGANVTIASGETKAVYLDGAGSGAAVVDSFATFSVANARFADGSNSAPSISFTSDTNTGIYRGGTDILKFVTAGTDAITIDASQDVTLAGSMQVDGAVDMASTLIVNDSVTFQSSGSSKPVLTLKNTNADTTPPSLTFQKDSASPADNDEVANINFYGDDDGGSVAAYANLKVVSTDVSDGVEDGKMTIKTMVGGVLRNKLDITSSEVVINEDSIDSDFRVESDASPNGLFLDGGSGHVGIHAVPTTTSSVYKGVQTGLGGTLLGRTDDTPIYLSSNLTYTDNWKYIANTTGTQIALATNMQFFTVASGTAGNTATLEERVRITSGGAVGIGTTSPASPSGFGTAGILHLRGATSNDCSIVLEGLFGSGGRQEIGISSGKLFFNRGAATGSMSTSMVIDSSGNVGIGTTSPSQALTINDGSITSNVTHTFNLFGATGTGGSSAYVTYSFVGDPNTGMFSGTADTLKFATGGSERMRIDSAGRVGIGVIPTAQFSHNILQIGHQATLGANSALSTTGQTYLTHNLYYDTGGTLQVYNTSNANEGALLQMVDGTLKFSNSSATTGTPTVTERMRITNTGEFLVGKTSNAYSAAGFGVDADTGIGNFVVDGNLTLILNRYTNDGTLVSFRQDHTQEGSISVSGTTVSYNGGHLSRWSQLADNTRDNTIVKGTVMTNLDQMAEWTTDGVTEDNEQLNCMAVSSVEGDANVAGVFVNWDNDDDVYTNDMNIAMTGDMVIRIAQGTTVTRGDLLMSAGDGTAKPQGDDIVRSKTIAKVTSTNVSHTYDDGTYLVPCVLMAC